MKQPKKSKTFRTRGSTIVEMGLVSFLLVTLLMGILEFGYMGFRIMQMSNAAREAARAASLGTKASAVKTMASSRCSPMTVSTTVQYSQDTGATYTDVPDYSTVNGAPTGSLVRVQITTNFQPLLGVIPRIKGRQLRASSEFGRE